MSSNAEPLAVTDALPLSSAGVDEHEPWLRRERRIFDQVDSHMQWMMEAAAHNQKKHVRLSYISLWLAVLAPLFAVTSTQRTLSLGLPDAWLPIASAVVTVLLSLTEGARRIGRYDELWRTMDLAMMELRSVRETFRDARVEYQPGSPERIAALKAFRKEAERVIGMAILAAHKTSKGAAQS